MKGTGPNGTSSSAAGSASPATWRGRPFPPVADDEQKGVRHQRGQKGLGGDQNTLGDIEFIPLAEVPPLERQLLVEKHLISPAHTKNVKHKAVILRDDEAVSIMVNEEDHLRIQALFPGLALMEAWRLCTASTTRSSEVLDFAFGERFGYLTACPTNVGTGMRASIMVHLPALTMTDQIRTGDRSRVPVWPGGAGNLRRRNRGAGQHLPAVEPDHPGTRRGGDHPAPQQGDACRCWIRSERPGSTCWLRSRLQLEDRIYRSYGILANARMITSHEAMQLLSDVRLGIDLGSCKGIEPGSCRS